MAEESVEATPIAPMAGETAAGLPPLLLGTYTPKIDAKGRMALPAKMVNKAAREYLRVFLSGASDQTPDRQGRVLVPQILRDYADLGDDIVVIGVGTRAEIWNRRAWEEYLANTEQNYADIADDVLPEVEF